MMDQSFYGIFQYQKAYPIDQEHGQILQEYILKQQRRPMTCDQIFEQMQTQVVVPWRYDCCHLE